MILLRICEASSFTDPFLLAETLSKRAFIAWKVYFEMKDVGDIINREEFYPARILEFMNAYAAQGKSVPPPEKYLIKFKKEEILSEEDAEDKARAAEERLFAGIDSFNKKRDTFGNNVKKK